MTKRHNDEVNLFKALMNQMHGRDEDQLSPGISPAVSPAISPAIVPEGEPSIPAIDVEAKPVIKPRLVLAASLPPKKPKKPKKPLNHEAKKRGRPATGKRSDRLWYGRTFYVRKSTDIMVENALFQLKRRGVDLDKSDMADALLMAWAAVYLDDQDDLLISDILKYLPDRDVEAPEIPEPEIPEPDSTTT